MKTQTAVKLLIPIAWLGTLVLSNHVFAEGGVIGSGGDGARRPGQGAPRPNQAEQALDVQIPLPPGLSETTLELKGENITYRIPIQWQTPYRHFAFRKCRVTPEGRPVALGCTSWSLGNLNEKLSVSAGYYQITYSNSLYETEIRAGESKQIQLQRLFLPESSARFEIQILRDLSDSGEKRKLANDWVGMPEVYGLATDDPTNFPFGYFSDARRQTTGRISFCDRAKIRSPSNPCYRADIDPSRIYLHVEELIGQTETGTVEHGSGLAGTYYPITSSHLYSYWIPHAQIPVTWVLPGTYTIWYRTRDGTVTAVRGIRVEE